MSEKYLLIVSCSKRKKNLNGEVEAAQLYDGPVYRMLRNRKPENVDVLILSAKYGLIGSSSLISYYDQLMTPERARGLVKEVAEKLSGVFSKNNYKEVFINLGKTYLLALDDSMSVLANENICWGKGPIGKRLSQLKNWLISCSNP